MRLLSLFLLALVGQVSLVHAAPAASVSGLSLNPITVTGGNTATGTVYLTEAAPAGGAEVELASSTPYVASVPVSVIVPEGATSADFTITTSPVTSSGSVMISAIYGGAAAYAMLGVNAQNTIDRVSIMRVQYDGRKRQLKVEAASSSSNATLSVYVQSTGQLIGTLGRKGTRHTGTFSWPANPIAITVVSSQGGSATVRISP